MIQIYSPGNTNFEQNGDMTLFPEICEASSELGGAWALEITHPIDDEDRWKYIEKEAVLSVPTYMGENQLYRIEDITDKNDADISAKAYPIFYDSAKEVFLMDKRPTAKNGQETLDILTEGTKYSGESNISTANTAYFVRRNLLDCILGEKSPSFVGVWGGEVLFDNFKVIVNERAGGDYGAEVRYGKNMVGVNVSENMSEVVTRIVPVAYNGRLLTSQMVDSPLINNYAIPYTKEIKFEDVRYFEDIDKNTDTTDLIVCNSQEELDAALIAKCNEQFEAGIDLFKATIDVDMVALENTEEYKDFKDLVKIGLGDDVSCYHTRLGIETKARAIKIVWDCITNSVKNVILGDYQYDFLKKFNSTMEKVEKVLNEDGSVGAQHIKGILNAMNTQLHFQKNVAQKQEVRAMLFEDLDPDSPTYGAMCYGTQGIQISNKRTADGRDWDWSTAATAHGFVADAIITGLLSDKLNKNWWNLDTGEAHFAENITIGDKTAEEIAQTAAQNKMNDFVNSVYSPQMDNLQKQIDGSIETHYYDYEPTLENVPASEWTTETEKQKHEGDLFYWKSKGYSYRFFKENDIWLWKIVQDTDITKALASAAVAQDTADSKRRVFISTPVPPYDKGDLWITSIVNGEATLKSCIMTRTAGDMVDADWIGMKYATHDMILSDKEMIQLIKDNRTTIITKEYIGTLKVVAGSVAAEDITGETITGKTFISEGQKVFTASNFVEDDLTIVQEIIMDEREFTIEDLTKYDIDCDGVITAVDYVRIKNLLQGKAESYIVDTSVEITGGGTDGTLIKTKNVYIRPDGLYSKNVTCENINFKNHMIADVVIEEGTSGIWRYRKWNSGEVELTARTGITCNVQTQVNSIYKSAIQSVQLPFTVYKAAPIVTCTDHNTWASSSPIEENANAIGVVLWRGGTYQSYTWGLSIIVTGRWKE